MRSLYLNRTVASKSTSSSVFTLQHALPSDPWLNICGSSHLDKSATAAATGFSQPAPDEPIAALILREWDAYDWRESSDALADWLNARWKKSGYAVQRHEVCFLLRLNGKSARMGLGDHLRGAFSRDLLAA
ncbi:hypothetical protein MBLNU459_g0039t1 [Dothideomycetes sp. NU459]